MDYSTKFQNISESELQNIAYFYIFLSFFISLTPSEISDTLLLAVPQIMHQGLKCLSQNVLK